LLELRTEGGFRLYLKELAGWGTFLKINHPSSRSICSKADKALFAWVCHKPDHVLSDLLPPKTELVHALRVCDLECTIEFSRRQKAGCAELFLLACYIILMYYILLYYINVIFSGHILTCN